jgi:predicted helicase
MVFLSIINNYLSNINRLYQTGNAREHSYRGDLQELFNQIINDNNIIVTNEPARITGVGAPDYSITKNGIAIGYIEAKDIGVDDLDGKKKNKEQFDRYKKALPNLIITDYLQFLFYQNGELVVKIDIAKVQDNHIVPLEENFSLFINNIKDFTTFVSQTIKSPNKLAKLMAGKARLLEDVIEKSILSDEQSEENNALRNQLEVFRANLIHDIDAESFADIYAQTIAYGLFAARLHDTTLEDFSRQEAQYLIPKSNPFLRGLFNYISGADCDDRLVWIIDSLADIFVKTDVSKLLEGFDQKGGMNDPIIHFYETFLGEYNPKLRKARGVWYTPESVVNFIVRAVDDILKDEFELEDGLLDESKIKIKVQSDEILRTKKGERKKDQSIEKEVHKVQILDPATGTGTFLAETIKHIKKEFWGGSWSSYVEEHLIPRLNGFELLMASYAMAHLKLDLLLMETGYKPTAKQKRFNIFLTNSLESHHEDTGNLFASYLANESKEADRVKKDTPVMVVMGNPPYAVSSTNKSEWIQELLKDYKKDLNERNIQPLSDDYIKFIRYGQHYIDKNGEGILAYISNNSFIDGVIHRQMRKSLLESFDSIYILDLHGNSRKNEVCPDGSKDENVFDIMQGVSINIFIKKKGTIKKLADVYHYDIYGKRDSKYQFLNDNSLNSLKWKKLNYKEPAYFFIPKDSSLNDEYNSYISLIELYPQNSMGIATGKDSELVKFDQLEFEGHIKNIRKFFYKPFDIRFTIFDNNILQRARFKHMKNCIKKENISLNIVRQSKLNGVEALMSTDISNRDLVTNHTYNLPLYLYQNENSLENERVPNLNLDIVKEVEDNLKLKFVNEKEDTKDTFAPIDLLDYIYAVLHSPTYREKYKEFLKIDFPRVPYPSIENFWQLVELGGNLRALHLLEDKTLDTRIIDINGEGTTEIKNKLNKKDFTIEDDKVILNLNEDISIINIPLIAWNFYIGGYQPAQKWLKDRVGRTLSRSDLKHYNKIINALCKTDEIMKKIDEVFEV